MTKYHDVINNPKYHGAKPTRISENSPKRNEYPEVIGQYDVTKKIPKYYRKSPKKVNMPPKRDDIREVIGRKERNMRKSEIGNSAPTKA